MRLGRFARSERGAAMVEMALVLPIIILLFLGMIDFGRAFFLYNNLTNAAREGARFGAAQTSPVDTVQIRTRVEQRIQDFSGVAAATNKVKVTVSSLTNPSDIKVEVVNYPFTPITPLPMVSSLVLNVKAVFRWEGS